MHEQPFETIESAQEYLILLSESIQEAINEIQRDREELLDKSDPRTLEAVELAIYLIQRTDWHLAKARRNLNHLRTVRDLVFKDGQSQNSARFTSAVT